MAAITLENIRIVRDGTQVLAIDQLDVADGELLVVLGPSGAGKTTLLRAIAGLEPLTGGSVSFDGVDLTETPTSDRDVAMVFQDNALIPHRDVRGNVSFPLEVRHTHADEIARRVQAEARVLEIEHLLNRMPGKLGAGHQQLVQAARALVRVPQAFLMDEPLARLDAHLRVQMRSEFRLLQQGYRVTTLLVTNDQAEAMTMADRILVLRDGRITQLGAPLDIYNLPENRFVAEFIGSPPMTVLPALLVADPPGYWIELGDAHIRAWAPSLELAAGGRVDVGIRPEDVVADETGVEVSTGPGYFDGRYGFVQVELAPGCQAEMRTDEAPPPPGQRIKVRFRRLHVFHPDTGMVLGRVEDGAG